MYFDKMTTLFGSQSFLRSADALLEDDLLGIYQQLQDIAETIMLPNAEAKLTQTIEDNNFNEIESFYKEIEQKEHQIKVLIDISTSLLTKTKEKINGKEQEMQYMEQNVDVLESEIAQGKERMAESNDSVTILNNQKEQLESCLNDLENGYEKTQENLFRSQEEFISLGEYKRKYQELNAMLDPNNELLGFYKQTNEDLKKEYKFYKGELMNNKGEIEGIRNKLTILLENYEKSISKQKNLNKQRVLLQDQISKIKEDIKTIQQMNTVLIKEIEKDQLKRIKGVPRISSSGFNHNIKATPVNKKTNFQNMTNSNSNNNNNYVKNEKMKDLNDKLSIDFLLENEEIEKNPENLKTPLLLKENKAKIEKIEAKTQSFEANNEGKTSEFLSENFNNFKKSLEINVVSQKSEEFELEADNSKYFKADYNKISLRSSSKSKKKNQDDVSDNWGGLFNFWVIGGLTVLVSVIYLLKTQMKGK